MPSHTSAQPQARGTSPRVGVPYRTRKEEVNREREKYDRYLSAIREAGGEPVEISLGLSPAKLAELCGRLDAFVFPGSPADVHPIHYGANAHPECGIADPQREQTDFALYDHALTEEKPVLAICYGVQSLNVFLGGTLVQDISSEVKTEIEHAWIGREQGACEPSHAVSLESGSRLAQLAGIREAVVNSSHHQSILEPGRDLKIIARAPDGVIEGVEGSSSWLVGVQWHPERMNTDTFAQALFRQFVEAARHTHVRG